MTDRYPVPRLAQQIEHEWADELAAYFNRPKEQVLAPMRPWFDYPPGRVRIELMDGSCVEFKYCVFIVSEAKQAIAVFTEHCGNHIFPFHEATVYRDGERVWMASQL